jgi:hypothetical protein
MSQGAKTYLVESYWPGITYASLADAVDRTTTALAQLVQRPRDTEFIGAILLPADETVYWLFHGDEHGVRTTAAVADIAFERVVEVRQIGPSDDVEPGRKGMVT